MAEQTNNKTTDTDKKPSRLDRLSEYEKELYVNGDKGLKPYLRLVDSGMPQNKINQIAWLLLNGAGCGFCKICRDEPCGIKDGEKCTTNIANYIRKIVHDEDAELAKQQTNQD